MPVFALAFVVVSVAEVASMVWVAHQVGVVAMLGLLIGVSIVGASLAKRVGLDVWHRFRASLASGGVPSGEVFEGVLVLFAAGLLAIPGFVTDVLGLLLLVPAVRSLVKVAALRRWRRRFRDVAAVVGQVGRQRADRVRVQAIRVGDGEESRIPPPG